MTSAIVVLSHAIDSGAESVAASLVQRFGPQAVRIVRPEMLSLASWSHRVDSNGQAMTRLTLPGTAPIDDSQIAAVLNRIRYLPVPRFHRASTKDRDYAGVEMQALVASWLAGLGERVVHVVRRHPWLTPILPLQHWAAPAAACGLPVAVSTVGSAPRSARCSDPIAIAAAGDADTVLVAGNRAAGPLSDTFGPSCLRVARMLGLPLLEFQFAHDNGTTVLANVDPLPSLMEPWAAAMTADLLASVAGESLP
jgi:hypothetical protein